MPLTTIYGDVARVIGSTSQPLLPQPLHPNAMAYIAAQASAGYAMTRVEIDAVNNLVWGLVGTGIWTKIKAIYPVIGTTAAAHKWNLKDPRDADAAFRLVFNGGGWTHSSTGMTPNGTTSWANTFLVPSTNLSVSSGHLSFYSRIQSLLVGNVEMGSSSGTGAANICSLLIGRITINLSQFTWGIQTTGTIPTIISTATQGFFIGNQNGANAAGRNIYRNSVVGNSTTNYGSPIMPTPPIAIGANNDTISGRVFFSSRQCSFASIGDGLTDVEVRAFTIIVQAYQTALGRQV